METVVCKVCGDYCGINGLRFGVCWDCATAESIIEDGTDMYDNVLAKTSLEKLEMLLYLGWKMDKSAANEFASFNIAIKKLILVIAQKLRLFVVVDWINERLRNDCYKS